MAVPCAGSGREVLGVTDRLPWHDRGIWLRGDTHTHHLLRRDPGRQMIEAAVSSGIDFVATTEHAQEAFRNRPRATLDALREEHPDLLIIAGIEWNIPAGDHATVLVEQRPDEWKILKRFARRFDREVNARLERESEEIEDDGSNHSWGKLDDAACGLTWLRELREREGVRSVVYLNHLSRRALYGQDEIAALQRAGATGFEAAAGHQRNLEHEPRLQRYDPAAEVGGLWDRLLVDGLFGITAGSDFHQEETAYLPGAFSRVMVYAPERSVAGVVEGLARGATVTVLGGVVSSVETRTATPGCDDTAFGGETLVVAPGADVAYRLEIEVPGHDLQGLANRIDRVEVISNAGGPARVAHTFENLGSGRVRLEWQLPPEATREAGGFFIRARGCRFVGGEGEDAENADLCFYTAATRVEAVAARSSGCHR